MHLVEIKKIEPTNLINEHGTFKCKVCDFKSQNKNAVKDHLLDHINVILPDGDEYLDNGEIEKSKQYIYVNIRKVARFAGLF